MLAAPQPTQYDVNFRAFDFPVRISPWFWLVAVMLGGQGISQNLRTILIWVFVVLVSILIHELGHAFAFRYFGISSHIVLYHFGGLAIPDSWGGSMGHRSISPSQQAIIAAAGPVAQIAAALLVMLGVGITGHGFTNEFGIFERLLPVPDGPPLASIELQLMAYLFCLASLYWALLNLVPVLPLDGGQIVRNTLIAGGARNPIPTSLMISICAGGVAAVYSLKTGSFFMAMMFGALAYSSFQSLNQTGNSFGGGW